MSLRNIAFRYITLSRTPLREQAFLDRVASQLPFNIERVEGFDHETYDGPQYISHKPYNCCALSHFKAMVSDAEWTCVFEDDCVIDPNFLERFEETHNEVLRHDGKLWMAGGWWHDSLPEKVGNLLRGKSINKHCWMYRQDLAIELREEWPRKPGISDRWICNYMWDKKEPQWGPLRWMCGQDQSLTSTNTGWTGSHVARWELPEWCRVPVIVVPEMDSWMYHQPHIVNKTSTKGALNNSIQADTYCISVCRNARGTIETHTCHHLTPQIAEDLTGKKSNTKAVEAFHAQQRRRGYESHLS